MIHKIGEKGKSKPQMFKKDQICRWKPGRGFELDGVPVYIVGVNYLPSYVYSNFWEDWRPEIIVRDLARIGSAGLNAVRIPIHWEYIEPAPGQFRSEALQRIAAFLDLAKDNGLFVMPWFLIGVGGPDYDISWRNSQSFFTDPMISHAENHLRTMARTFRHCPNILCWDICDEPEWFSRHPGAEQLPYNTNRFHQWVERMYQALKEIDPERAVTLGFGHIGTGNYGMDICRAANTLDVMAVTAYSPHGNEDLVNGFRGAYFHGYSLRFNDCAGKGVFSCEAPGWWDFMASPAKIGLYYRISLFSNLANDSQGVLPWVWTDVDDSIQNVPPLDKWTHEKSIGITTADGSLKPAGQELAAFAEFVRKYPPAEWSQVSPEVGVLIPAQNRPQASPVVGGLVLAQNGPQDIHMEFSALFHHYIFLRQAGFRVRYIWAEDLDRFNVKLLFLPDSAGKPLMTADWLKLKTWVERGGTLVSTSKHTSSVFNALFGVIVEGQLHAADDIIFCDCRDVLSGCEGLALPGGGNYLLVSPIGGDVLSKDAGGRPLVIRNRIGQGEAIFMAYPPEVALARIHPEKLGCHGIHAFFRAAASLAGLRVTVICPDPRIELDVRRHADGRLLAVAINHSRFPVTTSLRYEQTGTEKPVELPGNGVGWEIIKP